jgi:uncharacterized protein YciI
MSHYLIEYVQVGDPAARETHRGAHIAYRKGLGDKIALAGPVLDEDGAAIGSIIIVEAADYDAATRLAGADPYVLEGVLEVSAVKRFRIAAMRPPA